MKRRRIKNRKRIVIIVETSLQVMYGCEKIEL